MTLLELDVAVQDGPKEMWEKNIAHTLVTVFFFSS
jgi:hypothetical protein